MKALINKLNEAAELYYNYGTSPLSDKEYDSLLQQLKEEELRTGLTYSNSPTQKVGAPVLDEQRKIKIIDRPMLSLEKVYTQEEINDFAKGQTIVGMVKCDGLSVRIIYEDGQLVSANTRGNGEIGLDITNHIKYFKNVPLSITYKKRFVIDGEAVILNEDFNKLVGFKNSRNTAAGTLNLLDMTEVKRRNLSFIAWDIIDGRNGIDYLTQALSFAAKLGFQICPHSLVATNEEIRNEALEQGIPCDGVVWRYNDLNYGEQQGRTSHHWNYACAFKFYDETYQTKLTNIEFTMGRTGILTPVAIYEDVEIDGAVCNRASLHNLTIMEELLGEPYVDQEVEIYKANAIIPQVSSAIKRHCLVKPDEVTIIDIPDVCPICGQPLTHVRENDSEVLMCQNEACEGRLLNRLDHFCSRKGLDIRGLSKATLEKLIDWGWVNDFTDIFQLSAHRDEWVQKPGFGAKSVDNILVAIETARAQDLDKFIVALGIPLIGTTAAKELTKNFSSWAELYNSIITEFKFYELPNFGMTMHSSLVNYDYTIANKLIEKYITINDKIEEAPVEATLDGMNIVITGTLTRFNNRAQLTNEIVKAGGKVTSSVSKNTHILINNNPDSTSSKNIAAKNLNIPILTEEEFCSKYLPL